MLEVYLFQFIFYQYLNNNWTSAHPQDSVIYPMVVLWWPAISHLSERG